MKILILAHARSGSTTLSKWLSRETNYHLFLEPYNDKTGESVNVNDDYIVKELYNHLLLKNINIDQYINGFDVVIGLYRENVEDAMISMLHANKTGKRHVPYKLTEEEINQYKKNIPIDNRDINFIKEREEIIQKSDIVLVYEKIYQTKEDIERLKKFLKLDELKFLYMLDNQNRYRKEIVKII